MKQSLYIYNNGDLRRKDNTLQFTNYEGTKRDVPIERISDIYVMSEIKAAADNCNEEIHIVEPVNDLVG